MNKVAAAAFGLQALGFAIAAPLQTERFYDLFGSGTFAICVGVSLLGKRVLHPRQLLLSAMTLTWSLRLGSFLVYRISKDGKDVRFDKIKKDPIQFAGAWLMQGVWVFLTAYPVYYINTLPAARLASLGLLDGIGIALWLIGFSFEAISDYQKLKWQAKIGEEARKTNFINEGLWSYSRHPNYFGEITLWVGSFITCCSGVLATSPLRAASFAISPLLVFGLLYKLSGIPILERNADKKFGNSKSYQEYKKNVPELFPRLTPYKSKTD